MNGSSDAKAIVLDDIPIEEFRALLYYFYHEYVTRTSGLNLPFCAEYVLDPDVSTSWGEQERWNISTNFYRLRLGPK